MRRIALLPAYSDNAPAVILLLHVSENACNRLSAPATLEYGFLARMNSTFRLRQNTNFVAIVINKQRSLFRSRPRFWSTDNVLEKSPILQRRTGEPTPRWGSFASILACPQHVWLRSNLVSSGCPVLSVGGIGLDIIQAPNGSLEACGYELRTMRGCHQIVSAEQAAWHTTTVSREELASNRFRSVGAYPVERDRRKCEKSQDRQQPAYWYPPDIRETHSKLRHEDRSAIRIRPVLVLLRWGNLSRL
jgi:hypothetical protein